MVRLKYLLKLLRTTNREQKMLSMRPRIANIMPKNKNPNIKMRKRKRWLRKLMTKSKLNLHQSGLISLVLICPMPLK
jgi:hypothetical protein